MKKILEKTLVKIEKSKKIAKEALKKGNIDRIENKVKTKTNYTLGIILPTAKNLVVKTLDNVSKKTKELSTTIKKKNNNHLE